MWSIEFIDKLDRKDTIKLMRRYFTPGLVNQMAKARYPTQRFKYGLIKKIDLIHKLDIPIRRVCRMSIFDKYYKLPKIKMINELQNRYKVVIPKSLTRLECLECFDVYSEGPICIEVMIRLVERASFGCVYYSLYLKLLYANFDQYDICTHSMEYIILHSLRSSSIRVVMTTLKLLYHKYSEYFNKDYCTNDISRTIVDVYTTNEKLKLIQIGNNIIGKINEVEQLLLSCKFK